MNISFDFDRTEIDRFFFYWKNLGISEKKKKKKRNMAVLMGTLSIIV